MRKSMGHPVVSYNSRTKSGYMRKLSTAKRAVSPLSNSPPGASMPAAAQLASPAAAERSSTLTWTPRCASLHASDRPMIPAPTIITAPCWHIANDVPAVCYGRNVMARNPWTTLHSRIAYANEWLRIREDAVLRPDGQPGLYGVVE